MCPLELVVSMRHENQNGHVVDLANHEPEHVERRLIRPVEILDDEDGRSTLPHLVQKRRTDVVELRASVERVPQVAADGIGDVEHRPQRPRREQRLAVPGKDRDTRIVICTEAAHERRLADAGLSRHHHRTPAPCLTDTLETLLEQRQLAASFEKIERQMRRRSCAHRSIVNLGGLGRKTSHLR